MNNVRLFLTLSFLSFSDHILGQTFDPLVLGIPNFKPYTYSDSGKPAGHAVTKVHDILKHLPVTYEIQAFENYSQLIKALKKDRIQGFFLATQNAERDKYAILAKPIDYNNWTWFTLNSSDWDPQENNFRINAQIGTIGKTNTYRWLIRNGYRVTSLKREALPKALLEGQVDAVFLAQGVFADVSLEQGINLNTLRQTINKTRPFSIYISKRYLQKNADFLEQLNAHIPSLTP